MIGSGKNPEVHAITGENGRRHGSLLPISPPYAQEKLPFVIPTQAADETVQRL